MIWGQNDGSNRGACTSNRIRMHLDRHKPSLSSTFFTKRRDQPFLPRLAIMQLLFQPFYAWLIHPCDLSRVFCAPVFFTRSYFQTLMRAFNHIPSLVTFSSCFFDSLMDEMLNPRTILQSESEFWREKLVVCPRSLSKGCNRTPYGLNE